MINGKAGFLHLDMSIRETTLRGYSAPLRTLNAELVLIVPYGAERSSNKRRS